MTLVQVLNLGNVVRQSLPSLDAGFRHPCRNDGDFKSWLKQLANQVFLCSILHPPSAVFRGFSSIVQIFCIRRLDLISYRFPSDGRL